MFSSISNGYDDLWKAIIRPPRDDYRISDLGIIVLMNAIGPK